MIELVNIYAKLTLERHLATNGLQYFVEQAGVEHDWKVYGCGMFRPGEAYAEFVEAYSKGEMLGIIGLTIEEDILAAHEGRLRQLLGQILMHAPKVYMTDFQSAEWAPHYDIQGASHGGHPAWLCPPNMVKKAWPENYCRIDLNKEEPIELIHSHENIINYAIFDHDESAEQLGIIARNLGGCIAGALLGWPTIIMPDIGAMGFKQNAMGNHPLVRFAQRFNVGKEVVTEKGQLTACIEALKKGETVTATPQLVEAAKIEAYATLERMLPQPAPAEDAEQIDAALSVFGPTQERVVDSDGKTVEPDDDGSPTVGFAWGAPASDESSGPSSAGLPKVINPGDPFDPSTHYGPYYYSDGPGMIYHQPDGTKTRYPGPGRDWEGFETVADILRLIFKFDIDTPTMVSLGCGFGSDVLRFRKKGWDAWGCDISEWSVNQAFPGAKDYIVLGDITKAKIQAKLPKNPHLVCSFDFWEHIYLDHIDALLGDLAAWMPKGSFTANIICTTGRGERDMTIRPGEGFTLENSWFLISGHVTGRRWHWWANRFHNHGFKVRTDLCHLFQVSRTEDSAMSQSMSWRARNLIIAERR
jgi:hypothetical protein